MKAWVTHKLGSLCLKVSSGGTPLRSIPEYYENGTIPWMKTGEIKKAVIYDTEEKITEAGLENSSAKLIPANSVIVAMYGDGDTAGNVAINKIPITTNQACCNFTLDSEKAHYRFIYFYLRGSYNNLVNLKLGGSQQNLNAQSLKSFPITHPEVGVQKKIAAILSTYDDLIENNQRRIALLEKMAEEIYREWFVRMRFPGHEGMKKIKGVPESWKLSCLGNVAKFTMGQSPSSEFYNEAGDGLPFHQGVGTYGERFPRTVMYCSEDGRRANKGDILFSVRAPVGRLNIADREMIIGRGLAAIRHRKEWNSYLYYLLKVAFANEDIIGNGSIFNSVGKDELAKFPVFEPESSLVEKFDAIASTLDEQIRILTQATAKLISSRDMLLPRLISGKLSVENLNIRFPPSMEEMNHEV